MPPNPPLVPTVRAAPGSPDRGTAAWRSAAIGIEAHLRACPTEHTNFASITHYSGESNADACIQVGILKMTESSAYDSYRFSFNSDQVHEDYVTTKLAEFNKS